MLDLGLRQQPEVDRWTKSEPQKIKKPLRDKCRVFSFGQKGQAFLPELGLFFGDHSNLQLSGPEVHVQDRGQARYRQLEESKWVRRVLPAHHLRAGSGLVLES